MTDTNYDTDFYTWTQAQAALLRAKDWTQVDWGHLIEEIESLGDQYRHALQSHLRVLLWHLLKHRYQTEAADDLLQQAFIATHQRKFGLDLDLGQAVHIGAAERVERQRHTVDKVEEQCADVRLICLVADHTHLIRGL
jgi:hypothetical protein